MDLQVLRVSPQDAKNFSVVIAGYNRSRVSFIGVLDQ